MNVKKTAMQIRAFYQRSCEIDEKWNCLIKEMEDASPEERKAQFDHYYEDAGHLVDSMRVNLELLMKDSNIDKAVLLDAFIEAGMIHPEVWNCLYKRTCAKFCPDLHSKMPYAE